MRPEAVNQQSGIAKLGNLPSFLSIAACEAVNHQTGIAKLGNLPCFLFIAALRVP